MTGRPRYDTAANASAAQVIGFYSTSFAWACKLLSQPGRDHVRNIYALVRLADEIVDDPEPSWSAAERAAALDAFQAETTRALTGTRSTNLVVHAFGCTARRYGIGTELIDPFFASMRTDLNTRDHDSVSFAEYVNGSAEVVGLMCLRVFVDGDQAAYERLAPNASRLGSAFQKVNFLRDMAHDYHALGRTYFPGLDVATFSDVDRDGLLDDIDADLHAAAAVLPQLPIGSRRAVRAAHALFTELSSRLRASSAAQIRTTRVRVPNMVKARIVARSVLTGGRR